MKVCSSIGVFEFSGPVLEHSPTFAIAFPKDTQFFSGYFGERSEWEKVVFLAVTQTLEHSGKV